MSDVVVWRIAADTPAYTADDLTGAGARATGGRWNRKGAAVVYASTSRALACLETFVHFNGSGLPLNRYLVEITIPRDLWAARRVETVASLPVGWDADPTGKESLDFGTAWLKKGAEPLLTVPSVIVPEEANVLINPAHARRPRITARKVRKWLYDPRLVKAP